MNIEQQETRLIVSVDAEELAPVLLWVTRILEASRDSEEEAVPRWLNAEQAASLIGIGKSTFEKRAAVEPRLQKACVRRRRGRGYLYDRAEISKLIEQGFFDRP